MPTQKPNASVIVIFILFLCMQPADGGKLVLRVVGILKDLASFGLKLASFYKGTTTNDVSPEDLINDLTKTINMASTKVLNSLIGFQKLEQLNDVILAFHSSSIGLRNIISATNETGSHDFKSEFVRNYEEHDVTKHFRTLSAILNLNVPGFETTLIDSLLTYNRCNLSALREFGTFYTNLVSEGIGIRIVYDLLTKNITYTPEQILDLQWPLNALNDIQNIFAEAEDHCQRMFSQLAMEDLQTAIDAAALGHRNEQRYVHTWTDATFYGPMGTEQFHFQKYVPGRVQSIRGENQNKVAIYGPRGSTMSVSKIETEAILDDIVKNVDVDKDDEQAARKFAEAVEAKLNFHNLTVSVIVVLFDGDQDLHIRSTYTDKDSPVIKSTRAGVELRYSYDWWRIFHAWRKTANGSFKVYLYLDDTGENTTFQFGVGTIPRAEWTTWFLPLFPLILKLIPQY